MAAILVVVGAGARSARAQPPPAPTASDPLVAARSLFAEALVDEEAGRLADALDKFRRVRAVRDTAAVEYRIGTCQEGLGDPVGAFGTYRAARQLAGDDPQAADLARAASDRLQALGARIARLTLVLPGNAPPDIEVQVDDQPVPPAALADALPLAVGHHVVRAAAPGMAPFRSEIVLAEGAQVSIAVSLEAQAPAPPPPPPPAPAPGPSPLPGWLAIGGGVLLGSAASVLLILRHDDIAHLKDACPDGRCPASQRSELESTRNRALAEEPVALAFGVAGVVAAGVGAYLVVAARPPAGTAITTVGPFVAPGGGGVALGGVLR
jgi:hypothetical protein